MNTHWLSQFLFLRLVDLALIILFLLALVFQTFKKLVVHFRK